MGGVGTPSDDALLAGLAAGDADAAAAFVRRFQHRMYGAALAVIGDPGMAEDVAQEAFVRAWRHAAVYDATRGPVLPWLLRITRNLAIDRMRAERSRPADMNHELLLRVRSSLPLPDEEITQRTQMDRVRSELAQLPEEQCRAIVLAVFGGRTAREISELEDIPVGTAKTRIRLALLRLRKNLLTEHRAR